MKRLFLILAIYFWLQSLFVTVHYALGVVWDPGVIKNLKFVIWVMSIVLAVLFLKLYFKKHNQASSR
jgi:hypothetical protein